LTSLHCVLCVNRISLVGIIEVGHEPRDVRLDGRLVPVGQQNIGLEACAEALLDARYGKLTDVEGGHGRVSSAGARAGGQHAMLVASAQLGLRGELGATSCRPPGAACPS